MREYLEFLRQAVQAATPLHDSARREPTHRQEREVHLDLTHRLFA